MRFVPTIGLEVHTQLNTKTKLFCADKNDSDEVIANRNICPICLGHPGTLPVLNAQAVKKTIRAGLALGCKINQFSKFDRKNYFYPDLPKGYQISQYDIPFCVVGTFLLSNGKVIRIRRIHLEEDTGRLIHEGADSLVDFNRAGVPLIELVTEPDFTSSSDVLEFAKELQLLWRYLKISEADMEKGQMRVEANISLAQQPTANSQQPTLGTKVEVKNLNSFKAVKDAVAFEIKRQEEVLAQGGKIIQETRGWDPVKKRTFPQRKKETEQDYRYFPEPDLPPVVISDDDLREIRASIPELPFQRRERFMREYALPLNDAKVLVEEQELGEYFEQVASELTRWEQDVERTDVTKEHLPRLVKLSANYLITELPKISELLKKTARDILATITPENFAELMVISHKGGISSSVTQEVLIAMAKGQGDPHNIIDQKGLWQVSETSQLEKIAKEVIAENPKAIEDYCKGNTGAIQFLVGKAMAKSKGKANPQVMQTILQELLSR